VINRLIAPNPVVVVPVHRQKPTADEQLSLRQCHKLLGHYPIRVVHPEGLELSEYHRLLPNAKSLPVPNSWMASIQAYNRMMINPAFFRKLDCFTHLLIHEPDAIALSDKLLDWCSQPYDYIGAPWFDGFHQANPESPIIPGGNSGFSLIRVSAIKNILRSGYRWMPLSLIARELKKKALWKPNNFRFSYLLKLLGVAGQMRGAHLVLEENFDLFLCRHIPYADPTFAIAPPEIAIAFSWEVNPKTCYELNNARLPFGIHAWARYDRLFVEQLLAK